ncbi:7-cyano-7-deazaguanine synthase QueC [bacterium]|nr:7-cyano-7-deazaguanine synthase QueC [bacterium]
MPESLKAVILLSGGIDSSTTLAIARDMGFKCYALSFRYGQNNYIEIESAKKMADRLGAARHIVLDIDLSVFGGSALTGTGEIPKDRKEDEIAGGKIPVSYVPARNTVFLSLGLAWAESIGAHDIFIGVNALDYSGYPDCREEFIRSFEKTANLGTKQGVQGHPCKIHTPLINLSKAEIITRGTKLGVDYSVTISCYDPDNEGRSCGRCDSCLLRKKGFREAGIDDPTEYVSG